MKKLLLLFAIFLNLQGDDQIERAMLDEIVVHMGGKSGGIAICRSDAWLPGPMGITMPLEQVIIKQIWLMHADAHDIKMNSDGGSEYAERYLDNLQEQRGVSRDTLGQMCAELGYTIADLKNELNTQYLMQQAIEVALTARGLIHVSPRDIQEFHDTHPIIIPITYTLQQGMVKGEKTTWEEPYQVRKNELGGVFSDIATLEDGAIITTPIRDNGEQIIYKVVSRGEEYALQLYDRYDDILHLLQEQRYQNAYKMLTLELLKDPLIKFTHQEDYDRVEAFIKDAQ